jgi:hypothetical protein
MQLAPTVDPLPGTVSVGWRIGIVFSALVFAALNYLLAAFTDMQFASLAGAVHRSPTGWTQYSTPDWMFGSLLGPALALSPVFFFAALLFSGATMSVLVIESVRLKRFVIGRRGWLLTAIVALWILRVPLPGQWTLYYHVAVLY